MSQSRLKPPKIKETAIVQQCQKVLAMRGIFAWRQNTGGAKYTDKGGDERFVRFGKVGAADITGILSDGRRLEIECKVPGGEQSEEQKRFQHIIEGKRGVYLLVCSPQELLDKLVQGDMR